MEATETKSSAVDKLKSALPLAILVGVGAYLLLSTIITAGYLLGIGGLRHRVIDNGSAVEIRRYRGTERDVIIPSHLEDLPVTRIRADAFYRDGIHLLRRMRGIIDSVTIPDTVTYIGSRAFMNNRLAYVTIPDSVTYIGRDAFSRNRLTSITIPDSVTHLSGFSGNQITYVTIPNNVTHIGQWAFSSNQIAYVTIPNSVTHIGQWAFRNNELTAVTIPDAVTYIGEMAFRANQLAHVTIPDSVTYIGSNAFRNNRLNYVSVPSHATVAENAFDRDVTVTRRERRN